MTVHYKRHYDVALTVHVAGPLHWSYGQNATRTTTVFTKRLSRRTRQYRQYYYCI